MLRDGGMHMPSISTCASGVPGSVPCSSAHLGQDVAQDDVLDNVTKVASLVCMTVCLCAEEASTVHSGAARVWPTTPQPHRNQHSDSTGHSSE
jgi:hypothetical protein